MPASAVHFDHIAFALPSIAAATPFLVGELGGEPLGGGPSREFRAFQWTFAGGGVLEVLEPNGPPGGFVHRFLASRGPGIHHVTFKVPDLDAGCERAERAGYRIVGYDASDPGWKEAFLHPKQAQGIVVQLAESDGGAGGGWSSDPPPPSPQRGARRADVVGLRLSAESEAEARRLWSEVAGGEPTREGERLVLRWPGSHLRLAVEVDPSRPPGPVAVELAGLPAGALPAGRHPVLGGDFVVVEI